MRLSVIKFRKGGGDLYKEARTLLKIKLSIKTVKSFIGFEEINVPLKLFDFLCFLRSSIPSEL